jgi:hypothetical protein
VRDAGIGVGERQPRVGIDEKPVSSLLNLAIASALELRLKCRVLRADWSVECVSGIWKYRQLDIRSRRSQPLDVRLADCDRIVVVGQAAKYGDGPSDNVGIGQQRQATPGRDADKDRVA